MVICCMGRCHIGHTSGRRERVVTRGQPMILYIPLQRQDTCQRNRAEASPYRKATSVACAASQVTTSLSARPLSGSLDILAKYFEVEHHQCLAQAIYVSCAGNQDTDSKLSKAHGDHNSNHRRVGSKRYQTRICVQALWKTGPLDSILPINIVDVYCDSISG